MPRITQRRSCGTPHDAHARRARSHARARDHDDHDHGHHGGPPHESPLGGHGCRWSRWRSRRSSSACSPFEPLLFGDGFGESIYFNAEHARSDARDRRERAATGCSFGAARRSRPRCSGSCRRRVQRLVAVHQGPHLPGVIDSKLKPLRVVLENKYYFDWFNENVLAAAAACSARSSGRSATRPSSTARWSTARRDRRLTRRRRAPRADGFLYSYAFWMVIGLAVMLGWFLTRA